MTKAPRKAADLAGQFTYIIHIATTMEVPTASNGSMRPANALAAKGQQDASVLVLVSRAHGEEVCA